MTKTVSVNLKAHYALGSQTIAHLVKMTRRDGIVLAVTLDHDLPLLFEAVTYDPVFSLSPSNIESSSSLNVDNLDAKGALMLLGVNESEIQAGLWDMCEVRVQRVNWADLTMGSEKLTLGWFGELSQGDFSFTTEVRSLKQKLQSVIGGVISASCDADFTDARCGVVPTENVNLFSNKAVSTIVLAQRQFTVSALTQAADFFTAGKATWVTGANAGLSKEIKVHATGGNITLQEPMPYAISVGDTVTFLAGCLKRKAEDCQTKHNNVNRFRGFDGIPGQDQVMKGT